MTSPLKTKLSDAALRERSGRGWDDWFALLDAWGATRHTHTEIARWLVDEHRVDSWSSQSISVGYEQERGMRVPGQGADGHFSASGSKVVDAPVDRLFEVFTDAALRRRWLPDEVTIRGVNAPKSLRMGWVDGQTRVVVGFTVRDAEKTQVAVLHEKLTDAETAARLKDYWKDRLSALKDFLEG